MRSAAAMPVQATSLKRIRFLEVPLRAGSSDRGSSMGMLNLKSCAFRTCVPLSAMALFAFMAVAAQTPSAVKPAQEFVIRSVRVFDGSRVIPRTDVWVHDGRIRAIGTHVSASAAVHAIDGTGKTLLPGLIDSHVHTWGTALEQALVFGVTTALDMFTDFRYAERVKKEQAAGKGLALADLRSAGTLVTAPKGHGTTGWRSRQSHRQTRRKRSSTHGSPRVPITSKSSMTMARPIVLIFRR